jgi:DNA-binding protein HU-beta
MNKGELIASIAESNNMSRVVAARALDTFLANVINAIKKGDRVTIVGFGSFRVVERAAQKGRNPRTGQSLLIPAHNVVKFTPGRRLYDRVQ